MHQEFCCFLDTASFLELFFFFLSSRYKSRSSLDVLNIEGLSPVSSTVYYWLVQRIWACFYSKVFTVLGFSLVFWRLMSVILLLTVLLWNLNATSAVLACSENGWGTTCEATVWQVLIPLVDKRSRIFHQIIKPWTYFQFSFDLLQCIITPISYQPDFVQLVCVLALHLGFSLSPYIALRVERWSPETHPFLLSWLCWSSDGNCAELAWFVSVGFQQPALRHRNNRNVPKALTAKTVPVGKCLLQKTVLGAEVSSSSRDSCQTRHCLTSRTTTVNLATDAAGRSELFLRWGRSTW